MSRGRKELFIALAALPVLLVAGVYVGGRISGSDVGTLKPAAGIASPLVTVVASPPAPVATVKAPAPTPVVTVQPPAPRPAAPPVVPMAAPPAAPGPTETPKAPVLGPVAPADPPPLAHVVLGPGSAGSDVRAWQEQMARRTWRIRVDGIFGPESERVARRFQRNKGLRVDGRVGRQTWDASWRLPVIR